MCVSARACVRMSGCVGRYMRVTLLIEHAPLSVVKCNKGLGEQVCVLQLLEGIYIILE